MNQESILDNVAVAQNLPLASFNEILTEYIRKEAEKCKNILLSSLTKEELIHAVTENLDDQEVLLIKQIISPDVVFDSNFFESFSNRVSAVLRRPTHSSVASKILYYFWPLQFIANHSEISFFKMLSFKNDRNGITDIYLHDTLVGTIKSELVSKFLGYNLGQLLTQHQGVYFTDWQNLSGNLINQYFTASMFKNAVNSIEIINTSSEQILNFVKFINVFTHRSCYIPSYCDNVENVYNDLTQNISREDLLSFTRYLFYHANSIVDVDTDLTELDNREYNEECRNYQKAGKFFREKLRQLEESVDFVNTSSPTAAASIPF